MARLLRERVSWDPTLLPWCYTAISSGQLQHKFQRAICKYSAYLQLVFPGKVSRKIVSDALSKTSPQSPLTCKAQYSYHRIRFIQASATRTRVSSLQRTAHFLGSPSPASNFTLSNLLLLVWRGLSIQFYLLEMHFSLLRIHYSITLMSCMSIRSSKKQTCLILSAPSPQFAT